MKLEISKGLWVVGGDALLGWLVASDAMDRRATDGPAIGSERRADTARRAMLEKVVRDMIDGIAKNRLMVEIVE